MSPVLLGPGNCVAATGLSWRHLRDNAPALGVPLLRVGRKQCVRADQLLAALDRAAQATSAASPTYADAAAAIRQSLGLRRIGK